MSFLTEATPLSVDGWRQSNLLTAKSLTAIAEAGGPRCCKRDSFIAVEQAIAFLSEEFGVELPSSEIICKFSELNKQCLKTKCKFYNGSI